MEEINTNLLNKKNVITLLVIGIMLLVIPAGVRLANQTQFLRSKAAVDPITFTGANVNADATTTNSTTVTVELRSPLGPPVPTATASATPLVEGRFCGGIAANLPENQCPTGYRCQIDVNHPDASGKCTNKE